MPLLAKNGNVRNFRIKDPVLPIYISGFLDLLGVSMIIPLIMSHCRDLGASSTVSGILGSTYGAFQLFSSPLVGQWSDLQGRRFTLLVCLFMISCGYASFILATTMTMMFVARVPLGMFKHSQTIGKAYLADITPERDHSEVFGNFNAASSIGFILGPVIAGHIAETPGGFYKVAMLTTVAFIINFVLIWMFIPINDSTISKATTNVVKKQSSTAPDKKNPEETGISSAEFFGAMSRINWDDLWDLFLIRFLAGSSMILFRSNFSLMLIQRFSTTPSINGYIISFNSLVSTIVGFFTGSLSNLYSSNATLLQHLIAAQAVTLLCLALSPSTWLFVACLVPLGMVTTIARVAIISLTIQRGGREEIGTLMGFSQSCMSFARILGPLVSGMIQEVSPSGPGIVGACCATVAMLIMVIRPQDPDKRKRKKLV